MLKCIPHKNNAHSLRTFLFIFFVMLVSAGGAYFALADPRVMEKSPNNLTIDNPEQASETFVVDDTPIATPELLQVPVETIKPSEIIPAERSKDPLIALEEAKKYVKPQIKTGKYIDISLKYQNMIIFEDGKILDAYQISSGKRGMESPVGIFKVENKASKAWSKGYGLWMPNWMAIIPSGKIGIHELPVWPGGYQEGANHLGTPVSHGCVRLGVGAAKRVFDWAEIGTPVIVHL